MKLDAGASESFCEFRRQCRIGDEIVKITNGADMRKLRETGLLVIGNQHRALAPRVHLALDPCRLSIRIRHFIGREAARSDEGEVGVKPVQKGKRLRPIDGLFRPSEIARTERHLGNRCTRCRATRRCRCSPAR